MDLDGPGREVDPDLVDALDLAERVFDLRLALLVGNAGNAADHGVHGFRPLGTPLVFSPFTIPASAFSLGLIFRSSGSLFGLSLSLFLLFFIFSPGVRPPFFFVAAQPEHGARALRLWVVPDVFRAESSVLGLAVRRALFLVVAVHKHHPATF